MKLRSQRFTPISFSVVHNLVLNLTPEGQFQAVRVVRPGKPDEGDFEVLFEGSKEKCLAFLRKLVS
ncbi:MAG TPA: hypothetical protein VE083_07605 [Terriglobales bacterium]|nr:hypothetical protein [Terriglobales bacterium]